MDISTVSARQHITIKACYFLAVCPAGQLIIPCLVLQDSSLLVSCSADKNIRIWGLDFGDCHKSIFAHDESVMCVKFVADTHLLFSAGKDALLKCWDADNFQHVLTLKVDAPCPHA